MHMKYPLYLFFVAAVVATLKDLSIVDDLRQSLIEMDENLHMDYRSGVLTYINIIDRYYAFGKTVDDLFPIQQKQYFNNLNSLSPWKRVKTEIDIIDNMYGRFRQIQNDLIERNSPFQIEQWIKFTEIVLNDPSNFITRRLLHITDIVVTDTLFYEVYKESQSSLCDSKLSPQQIMYNLYNIIALTELKGYAMLQFSYNILKLHNKKNYTQEIKNSKNDYAQIVLETLKHVKIALAYASKEIYRCDPYEHKEGVTFEELKEVFQGYIVNEVDLNPHGTCRENCAFYTNTKVYDCYASQFCSKQKRCNGNVVKCQYIDSDMWICPAESGSFKRYNYINYENGKRMGNTKFGCNKSVTKVDSWWRWLFWHCSYCFCYCDDQTPNSDRYFNLRNVTADIDHNKVIVGVKLQKVNNIVHIQIKEGLLLPRGQIDPDSVNWRPLDNYTISQHNIKKGVDYHMIDYQKRAIDLDDLVSISEDQLLTGLRFRVVGAHLNLEIRVTPFNFTTGKLLKDRSYWHSNDNTDADGNASEHFKGQRTEIVLDNKDVPIRSEFSKTRPDSKPNQYLHFQPTDLEMDASQSTIPFLDIQPVEADPPMPISGAGIFHKGQDKSGGFVALKLITYDFSKHLNADIPHTPDTVIGLNNEINAV